MRRLARCGCGEGLVDGDGDRGDFATLHAFEGNEISRLVGNVNAQEHTDLLSAMPCRRHQQLGIIKVDPPNGLPDGPLGLSE